VSQNLLDEIREERSKEDKELGYELRKQYHMLRSLPGLMHKNPGINERVI